MSTHQPAVAASPAVGWSELWRKEDWWAVWLGLGTALVAYALFASGTSIGWIAVAPQKRATFHGLAAHFQTNVVRYLAQFAILLGLFSIAASAIGYSVRHFLPGFLLVYLLSITVFAAGTWEKHRPDHEAARLRPLGWQAVPGVHSRCRGECRAWLHAVRAAVWRLLGSPGEITGPVGGRCGGCRHFDNDSATLEASFPGLAAMGSGFASVRASDGICRLQGLYLSARAGCPRFKAVAPSPAPGRLARGGVPVRSLMARFRQRGSAAPP